MRQCPLCSRLYEDSVEFCPRDTRVLYLPDPLLGRVVDEKYRIEALLGGGGQGAVYRAFHINLERLTAVKVLRGMVGADEDAVDRFTREARAVARIKHPNIVTVYDYGFRSELGAYMAMEHLSGRSLHEEIRHQHRLSITVASERMAVVARAVHAAHQQGVVHGDIKPGNIFLEQMQDGPRVVKVLDFGLAQIRDIGGSDVTAGTVAYMSPEQCRGELLDPRSDVYSLGCVLFEMLTGRPPFLYDGRQPLHVRHISDAPLPPSHVAKGVSSPADDVVLAALEKDRERRPESAAEFASMIDEVLASASERRSTAATPSAERRRRGSRVPAPLTSFVGRGVEIEQIGRLMEANRLVTITGASGSGKTRLAIEVARRVESAAPDGVWFVDLGEVTDPAIVPKTIAAAIGLAEHPDASATELVVKALRGLRCVVVLDNCEHVAHACALEVSAILQGCATVRILATSQEPMRVLGETVWPIQMLSVPKHASGGDIGEIERSEAVELFVARASAAHAGFRLTPENASAVARICESLDGIPLAVELAAARVRLLSLDQIANRLADRFSLLGSSGSSAQPRQRTLRAAMDWSHELLGMQGRILFRRLSVFAGFTIDAVEATCADALLDRGDVLDQLGLLLDRNLLVSEEPVAGVLRYRMLQTIRQYAAQQLRESGEARDMRSRHLDHFSKVARDRSRALVGPGAAASLASLESDHDNIRSALEWARLEGRERHEYLGMAASLGEFWFLRGHIHEGRSILENALEGVEECALETLALAAHWAGALAAAETDYAHAATRLEQSLAIRRSLGRGVEVARTLNELGSVAQWRGDYEHSERLYVEALATARSAQAPLETAGALNSLAIIARSQGDSEGAITFLNESLPICRRLADDRKTADAVNNLGVILASRGDLDAARPLFEENLALRRRLGDERGITAALNNLGEVAQLEGQYGRASALLAESLVRHRALGDRRGVAFQLEGFVSLAVRQHMGERALRLAGAASSVREEIGAPLSPAEHDEFIEQVAAARALVGIVAGDAALVDGRKMSLDEAVALALETAPADVADLA